MSRIANILERARDSLADHDKQRWSDARLLRLVDEAQKDLARHSKLLKGTTEVPLFTGQAEYKLPEDLELITRATFDNAEIGFYSFDQMDEQVRKSVLSNTNEYDSYNSDFSIATDWQTDEGSGTLALIYDNRDMQSIRVYPIPIAKDSTYSFHNAGYFEDVLYITDSPYGVLATVEETDTLVDVLGVAVSADSIIYVVTPDCDGVVSTEEVDFDSPYGLLAEIEDHVQSISFHDDGVLGVSTSIDEYSEDSPFGVIAALYDPSVGVETLDGPMGVASGVSETDVGLKVWYIRTPATVVGVNDSLELPSLFDTAIRHYVVGNAFLDDNDAAYRQKGQDAIALYDRELNLASDIEKKSGIRKATALTTSYRGPFE